jgi:hypothetical protein
MWNSFVSKSNIKPSDFKFFTTSTFKSDYYHNTTNIITHNFQKYKVTTSFKNYVIHGFKKYTDLDDNLLAMEKYREGNMYFWIFYRPDQTALLSGYNDNNFTLHHSNGKPKYEIKHSKLDSVCNIYGRSKKYENLSKLNQICHSIASGLMVLNSPFFNDINIIILGRKFKLK